jgi:hypothetical protein
LFFEIEKEDDFILDSLPEDERNAIEEENLKFMEEEIEPQVKRAFAVCTCQMGDYIQRMESKRTLLNIPPQQYNPVIDQEEFDKYSYAVIVISEHGKMTGVSAIIRSCKTCHKLDYWGDIEIFGHMIAEITTNFVSAKQAEEQYETEVLTNTEDVDTTAENPLGNGAVLTDIPTDPEEPDELETEDIRTEETPTEE